MNKPVDQAAFDTINSNFPARLPHDNDVNDHYGINLVQWKYLTDIAFPAAKTQESIILALDYCRARKLDIMKKPVHIVPMWNSAKGAMVDTVWPSINEYRTTAHRTGEYAGLDPVEHGPAVTKKFTGRTNKGEISAEVTFPEWSSVTCYRMVKGVRVGFAAKIYWLETYASIGKSGVPNEMWAKRAYGQPDKCVEAAALRKAFPEEIGNDYTAEEMHGREIFDNDIPFAETENEPSLTPPPPPPPPTTEDAAPADSVESSPDQPVHAPTGGSVETEQDPGEILSSAEEWFTDAKDIDALESAWTEFQHFQETLPEDDAETLRGLYANRVNELEPNTLASG